MYGHIDCLQYAYSQGVPLLADLHQKAVSFNKINALECVVFAHDRGLPLEDECLCESAVSNENLELLKYLHENGCPWTAECFINVLDQRSKSILEYLCANECPWDSSVCHYAAENEDAFAVLYLLRHGCSPSDNIWIFKGKEFLDILQAFKEAGHNPEASSLAMSYAVLHGDLSIVKLMTEEGFQWSDEASAKAAQKGFLEILEFAYTSGVSDLSTVCTALMGSWSGKSEYRKEEVECFKFPYQRCPRSPYENYSYKPAHDGQIDLLKFLHEQGYKWDTNVAVIAANSGHVECLEFLLSHGCPRSKAIGMSAAQSEDNACLEVATKYGCV